MNSDDDLVLVAVVGAGVLLLGPRAPRQSSSTAPLTESTSSRPIEVDAHNVEVESDKGGGWWWPIPTLLAPDGTLYSGEVSSDGRWRNSSRPTHQGQDMMWRRVAGKPPHVKGDGGTANWWAPKGAPVLAARAGVLWSAQRTGTGYTVVVDHGRTPDGIAATAYYHLESLAVPARKGAAGGPRIDAGQLLGAMGASPKDAQGVRHLHFEMWTGAGAKSAVDPTNYGQRNWGRRTWKMP